MRKAITVAGIFLSFGMAFPVFADSTYAGCDNLSNSGITAGSFGFCATGPDVNRVLVNVLVDVHTLPGAGSVYFKIEDNFGGTYLSCRNVSISSTGLTTLPIPVTSLVAGRGINITYYADAGCSVGGTGLVMNGPPYSVLTWANNIPIDFNNTSLPNIYGTSSTSTATRGLFNGMSFASSTANCNSAGNIFAEGICAAFNFVFVPDPQILNQYALMVSTSSASGSFGSRFPISWVLAFQTLASSLSAGTSSMMTLSLNLNGKMASTSYPQLANAILPNITLLSKSTIVGPYMSQSLWDALQALIAAMLWLGLFADIYHYVRHRMHRV